MATPTLKYPASKGPTSFRSSTWFITVVVAYSEFVDSILYTIVLPVVPFALSNRVGVPEESVPVWNSVLISTYGVAAVLLSPPSGYWIGRCESKRTPFLASLITLVGSTLMMWLGRTLFLQILARIIQGAAASLVYISGSVILIEQAGTDHVTEHMGWISTALSVGGFAGPLLGGIIFDKAGYDAVFGLMMAFIGLDIVLRLLMAEKPRPVVAGHDAASDTASGSDTEVELDGDAYPAAVIEVKDMQLSSPNSSATTIVQSLSPEPESQAPPKARFLRVPTVLRLCASSRMAIALWNIFMTEVILAGMETVLAIFVENLWGWDSLGAGLIYLPFSISSLISPLIGRLADRIGSRWPVLIGFIMMCPLLILIMLVNENTLGQKALFCVLLTFIGLGINLALDPLLGEICRIVQEVEANQPLAERKKGLYSEAYGMFNSIWHVGYVLGPLWAGLMRDSLGWTPMCWSLGLATGITALMQILEWKRPWVRLASSQD